MNRCRHRIEWGKQKKNKEDNEGIRAPVTKMPVVLCVFGDVLLRWVYAAFCGSAIAVCLWGFFLLWFLRYVSGKRSANWVLCLGMENWCMLSDLRFFFSFSAWTVWFYVMCLSGVCFCFAGCPCGRFVTSRSSSEWDTLRRLEQPNDLLPDERWGNPIVTPRNLPPWNTHTNNKQKSK